MPKIGMRIIKSAVACYICFLIYLAAGQRGIPFYAAIAAILCMQQDVSNSFRVALNRTVGTLVGGAYGILLLTALKAWLPPGRELLQYTIISASVIPLIYITVLLKKNSAAYITCVVFLSITVSHGEELLPYAFGLSRVMETLIGIFVSLGVNTFRLPRRNNRHLLFVCDLGGTLLNKERRLTAYSRVRLNRLIRQGANIALATSQSPAVLPDLLNGLELKLPVIALNGAALFDLEKKRYLSLHPLSSAVKDEVTQFFNQKEINCFTYTVFDDLLHIYYRSLRSQAERRFYEERKLLPLNTFLCSDPPAGQTVLFFTAFIKADQEESLLNELRRLACTEDFHCFCHKPLPDSDVCVLSICSAEATKGVAAMELMRLSAAEELVAFGDGAEDLALFQQTKHSYAPMNAEETVRQNAAHLFGGPDGDAVVKKMEKLFHSVQHAKKRSPRSGSHL
jgi:hydroxymethylpyrimidine pyrophosphatase-like HAD family hydrolase